MSEQELAEKQVREEREKLIAQAKLNFPLGFFKNFAFSGAEQSVLAQKSLEEYIKTMDSPVEIQQLIVSMLAQAYELNSLIPNVDLLFYKIFTSPISTREQRAGQDKDENLLVGNIFADKQVPLSYFGYKSLLETLIISPKKKHFKKVVSYILRFETPESLDPELIDMMVRLSIDQKYPIFMGQTLKHLL